MEPKQIKNLLATLEFTSQDGAKGVFRKEYPQFRNYAIVVDCDKKSIDYGNKIKCGSKRTQNFSHAENFVVLECVDRLLTKGYKPENIELEKIWPAGHGRSGELDICVYREGKERKEYLLIECKTYGIEFDKALTRMEEDGGQLFTYFKFSNSADLLMLYASQLSGNKIVYRNEIVKIEEDYRSGDANEFYEKWNKLTKDNGIFEDERKPYQYESKALKHRDLKDIRLEDSKRIFIQFLEILRHNVVSDKPNAFNKIFTLFLCKIYDEKEREGTGEDLHFQWRNDDDDVKFQLRLTDLYKSGMKKFLDKEVSDFSKAEFEKKYNKLEQQDRDSLWQEIIDLRLQKNNEFAIKEVFDKRSFDENAVIVKAVVQLLEKYKVRYSRRQQFLSDFFELLLTTGLKQEVGQFFTPVPIAQFIIKSLPIDKIVDEKLQRGQKDDLLPYIMDFAAGSGHFLTESMHLIQEILHHTNLDDLKSEPKRRVKAWLEDPFDWAYMYIYGIEKDYRLVKVGKVGCYLHGDGLANVIHSDGLAKFGHENCKGKLENNDKVFPRENKQFDVVVSNPPYSVSTFKNAAKNYYGEEDFELYQNLTDSSSEIECLFVERTKQLLKDGGMAGIILPSSILSNAGIYAKTREMILRYFEIIAIAELGSGTFMATGTNTVVLFLRRRSNYDNVNLEQRIEQFFMDFQDVTMNGIETPVAKYLNYVWDGVKWDDYLSLLKREPSKSIRNHELYKEYEAKTRANDNAGFLDRVLAVEKEKLFYFILAYLQQVVIVKSGRKDAEKRFLGYEFSNRRGNEGIHPIQRGKMIDECTQMFDADTLAFDNPEKASTYIYRAFTNPGAEVRVPENLKSHVFQMDLVDMMTFDWATVETKISLAIKKKVKSKWSFAYIGDIVSTLESGTRPVGGVGLITKGAHSLGGEHIDNHDGCLNLKTPKYVPLKFYQDASRGKLEKNDVLICKDGALTGKVALVRDELIGLNAMINEHLFLLRCPSVETQKYLFYFLFSKDGQELLKSRITGTAQGGLNSTELKNIKIPLPPLDVQAKIVKEIEELEKHKAKVKERIEKLQNEIASMFNQDVGKNHKILKLGDVCELKAGQFVKAGDINDRKQKGLYPCYGGNGLRGYTKTYTHEGLYPLIGRQGALCGNVHLVNGTFHATEHALVVTPKLDVEIIWLYHKLISMNLNQYAKGTAQPGLSVMNLVPVQINLPPLSEQQKIVTKIEKLENEISNLQKELESFPERKNDVLRKWL